MTSPKGAHAIITGGSSGIGFATARALAARGARVSLLARRAQLLDAAADRIRHAGGQVATASVDVSDRVALNTAIASVTAELGPCDILVTSAGLARPGYFERLDDADFRELMEVNYFGTLYAIQAVVPSMIERRKGSVVGLSSAAGLIGVFGYTAYGPTKYAVRGLFESLRAELEPHGIHVGCVFPPNVDTPQLEEENRIGPVETRAISNSIKPISPDRVAATIVRGIERERFMIIPDIQTRLLARLGGLVGGVLASSFDRKARKARALG